MAFPVPALLTSIEDLLREVHWLEGLILVTDSKKASFVSISQLDSLLSRLRSHPNGDVVAEKLYASLEDSFGVGTAKPVLVLMEDGSFWLGLMGIGGIEPSWQKSIDHLNRCFYLSI